MRGLWQCARIQRRTLHVLLLDLHQHRPSQRHQPHHHPLRTRPRMKTLMLWCRMAALRIRTALGRHHAHGRLLTSRSVPLNCARQRDIRQVFSRCPVAILARTSTPTSLTTLGCWTLRGSSSTPGSEKHTSQHSAGLAHSRPRSQSPWHHQWHPPWEPQQHRQRHHHQPSAMRRVAPVSVEHQTKVVAHAVCVHRTV